MTATNSFIMKLLFGAINGTVMTSTALTQVSVWLSEKFGVELYRVAIV
jgi:hypothetical protein